MTPVVPVKREKYHDRLKPHTAVRMRKFNDT